MTHVQILILVIQMICYYKTVNLLYNLINSIIIFCSLTTIHQMKVEIYIGTYEGTLIILQSDLNEIKAVKSIQVSQNSLKSMCTINDQYLVTGGFDQELKVIDLHNYQEKVQDKENVGQITKIVKVNHKYFIVGLQDGTITLWDRFNWNMVTSARFHKKSINCLVVARQGQLLFSAGGSKLILWSAQTLKKAHQYKIEKDAIIQHIQATQDLKYVYYSNSKGQIYRITSQTNQITLIIKMPSSRKIQDFLIYSNYLILGNDLGQIMAWQLTFKKDQEEDRNKQDQATPEIQYQNRIWYRAHQSRVKQLKIINSIYLMVVTAGGNVSIWDFPSFLESVEHISQNYHLEGLSPLCSIVLKGRILCAQVVARLEPQKIQKKQQVYQKNQKKQGVRKQKKGNKNKLIKKQQKAKINSNHIKVKRNKNKK